MCEKNIGKSINILAIMMCVKNGACFIDLQLESIKNQIFKKFDLYISFNKSNDDSLRIIDEFILANPQINIIILKGKDRHFANNFIDLAKSISQNYKFYAFCDQDDIWEDFHLERAVNEINENSQKNKPYLCCSATKLIDKEDNLLGHSTIFKRSPSFENALVQSIAGGNTMIFNKKARSLLEEIDTNIYKIPSHDWMMYLIVTAFEGKVSYNSGSSVKYRQHKDNLIGSNRGARAFLRRLKLAYKGEWIKWVNINTLILNNFKDLPKSSSQKLKEFDHARLSRSINKRMKLYTSVGIYRQTFLGNINLFLAVIAKKI